MKLRGKNKNKDTPEPRIDLITIEGNGFFSWHGDLYKSDIIASMIRPKAQAVGKMVAKHIRKNDNEFKINPDAYIKFLLSDPNPLMSGQKLQEKLTWQFEINNNAFAIIVDDIYGLPNQIYPVDCTSATVKYIDNVLHLQFTLRNGKTLVYPYNKIIHLRRDFNQNDIFGTSPIDTIKPLMEIVNVTDQGIVKAIKNSNIIQWLLSFKSVLKDEDIKKQTKNFIKSFLNIDSDTPGAAAVDPRFEAKQVEYKSYIPNAAQMEKTTQRLYNYFNTNEKIVQSKYTEDEWNAYFESEIEHVSIDLSEEYTRKLFTRRERSFGNQIIFESSNLQYASMTTKLGLWQMVDRAAMTPNEWRKILNYPPLPGGDEAIRRLDTDVVKNTLEMMQLLAKENQLDEKNINKLLTLVGGEK